MKRDGHTHTEYCPHGTVEDVELLIQKALQLGFKEYSITEHAPLPKEILQEAGGDLAVFTTGGMALNDVNHYFKRMDHLRAKYRAEIRLHIGFEVDFFEHYIAWTTDFLNEYGSRTDDSILSVHFLPGTDGLRGIDYSPRDYQEGIVAHAGSFQNAQVRYYQMILQSLTTDLGPYKPKRLGHLSLCQKFQHFFSEDNHFSEEARALVTEILVKMKENTYELDLNTAGLYKEFCQEYYPPKWLLAQAKNLKIPLVYGSDSHDLQDVGRSYDVIEHWVS